ncbi:hypothetical protein J1N35_041658 [Gossypium stocksii]|uniref:Reverse transcriptase domain-containing protein n=1 Tax=Gossypium stocksii TaxID=47602 RepID=A0A9D3UG22_9ROSI|nr:hypothetical protein J1N35_041658 [Gossypium stocksii]
MGYVTTVSYSILMNGIQHEEFRPSKGLRQGDSMSPYLFLLCLEGFSTLLKMAKLEGRNKGTRVSRSDLYLTHLFFADDSILFEEATLEGDNTIKATVKEDKKVSGPTKEHLERSGIVGTRNRMEGWQQ